MRATDVGAGNTYSTPCEVATSHPAADLIPSNIPPCLTFSTAEYQRRWEAVANRPGASHLDGVAIVEPLNVPCLTGTDNCGTWSNPEIITAGTADPVFVAREYDADMIRTDARMPQHGLRTFVGDSDDIESGR